MLKYFCLFAFVGFGSALASPDNLAARNNFKALAGGISDKISDFINEVLRLPDTADKKLFLDPAELLLAAAEDLQNSIFDVDSSLSILELYRIDSEIDQLKIELDEYKKKLQTPVTPAPYVTTTPSYANADIKRSYQLICNEVERAKAEILTFPVDQCSGHKLIFNLTQCQNLCGSIIPYLYSSSVQVDLVKYSTDFRRCQSIVEIWVLLRNIQPDRQTLEKTCAAIGAIGSEINSFPIAQCERDPFLKDQKTLYGICIRLQREYSLIDPQTLERTYKDLESKFIDLLNKWGYFKGDVAYKPTTAQPYPTYPNYKPALYNYNFGRDNQNAGPSRFASIFKPLRP